MKIKLITVGKTKEKFWQQSEAEFSGRIKRYCALQEIRIKDSGLNPEKMAEKVREAEGTEILTHVQSGEYLVAMDVGGKQLSSEEFAQFFQTKMLHGTSRFTFVIGGPLGLPDSLLQKVDFRLSLSKMTFVHEMARVILLEQIYRAFTIIKGEKYHK